MMMMMMMLMMLMMLMTIVLMMATRMASMQTLWGNAWQCRANLFNVLNNSPQLVINLWPQRIRSAKLAPKLRRISDKGNTTRS